MTKATKHLSSATRTHLFKLITDPVYRRGADSTTYDKVPTEDGKMGRNKGRGESLRKFGYTSTLPSSTATRREGPDPGRYRVAVFTNGSRSTWWEMTHLPANTYKFTKIIFPRCSNCGGTSTKICRHCHGTARLSYSVEHLAGPCTYCNKQGFSNCASCSPPIVLNGESISKDLADWG